MSDQMLDDGQGPYFRKDPRASVPVTLDWGRWLEGEATTITSSAWSASPGVTLSSPTNTTTVANVVVSGGIVGSVYVLRNTVTCADGTVDSRSVRCVVVDR